MTLEVNNNQVDKPKQSCCCRLFCCIANWMGRVVVWIHQNMIVPLICCIKKVERSRLMVMEEEKPPVVIELKGEPAQPIVATQAIGEASEKERDAQETVEIPAPPVTPEPQSETNSPKDSPGRQSPSSGEVVDSSSAEIRTVSQQGSAAAPSVASRLMGLFKRD